MPDLPIHTARLTLRLHEERDLDRLLETYGDPEVARYLPKEPWTREHAESQVAKRMARVDYAGESGALGLVMDIGGDYVGDVVLFTFDGQPETAELGWAVHPAHGGHGYAAEAARELMRLAFEHYGLHRVVANLDARNTASARVCERLGLRREAHHLADYWSKGDWSDSLIYALLATEWPPKEAR